MKVVCTQTDVPVAEGADHQYLLFGRSSIPGIGSAAPTLVRDLRRQSIFAPQIAWDLLSLAVAVEAADQACLRGVSSDGWTRQIELKLPIQNLDRWQNQRDLLSRLLRFLSGDIWDIEFAEGGIVAPDQGTNAPRREQSVCLLSGGADSLTGGIDLKLSGKKPLFVSQVSKGDKATQARFSIEIAGAGHHLQLNHNINNVGQSERSQRARSFLFLAYGVLAATSLQRYESDEVSLYVPENGFISLNVPLTSLRIGSLSTRTTHPYYLRLFEELLHGIGIRVNIQNPFQLRTKGEMFTNCGDQVLLKRLVFESTSCGRYARTGFMHCGRCVPCIIRRAALFAWQVPDATEYRYKDLSIDDDQHMRFDDVKSVAFAVERVRRSSLDGWIGGALHFPGRGDVVPYREVVRRGLAEIQAFLHSINVL